MGSAPVLDSSLDTVWVPYLVPELGTVWGLA